MDIQQFIAKLPSLYENWGQDTIKPLSRQFEEIFNQLKEISTPSLMQLLNCAIESLEEDEIYCQIGCSQGINLIGALLNNQDSMAYAVDNLDDQQFNQLTENLTKFNLDEQVFFCNQDFEEFFADLNELQPDLKIGVYFYNGKSDYRSTIMGLLLAQPFLADRALIIINNSNYTMVEQANYDFINSYEQCNLLINLPTCHKDHPSFGNGITIFTWDVSQGINYSWQEIENQYQNSLAIEAIADLHLRLEFKEKPAMVKTLMTSALKLNQKDQFKEAIEEYKQALLWDKYNPYIYNNIASLYFKMEKYQEALAFAQIAVNLNHKIAVHQFNLGKILEKLDQKENAMLAYEKSINLAPEHLDSYINLAGLLLETNQLAKAELIHQKLITLEKNNFQVCLLWGDLLVRKEEYEEAIKQYNQALILKPKTPEILEKIARAYGQNNDQTQALLYSAYVDYRRNNYTEAIPKFEEFFKDNKGDLFDQLAWADCYQKMNLYDCARSVYLKLLQNNPNQEYLFCKFLAFLYDFGQTEEDFNLINLYAQNAPNNLAIQLEINRFLPHIYQDQDELSFYKNRFEHFLEYLDFIVQSQKLTDLSNVSMAVSSVKFMTNFLLQYQNQHQIYQNQQQKYGNFAHYVMSLKYPQWVKPFKMPSLTSEHKIKIGYLSDQIGDTSASKWIIGWLEKCDRNKFEIYCYATSTRTVNSEITNLIKELCDYYYYIPDDLEAITKQILENQLHILVFLAIGMWGATTQIASLRLAPVQCTTWGHPSTSGLPTIDYYLSGDLIEPENGQQHYTEKLIRLPNLGISYPKPKLKTITKTKADLNLNQDQIIYLSCQLIFKYLPEYDYIFPCIAQKVPQAKFLFIVRAGASKKESLIKQDIFYNRLKKAFIQLNLNIDDYCIFLPQQSVDNYHHLLSFSDVFLDTFAFSGGHTTFEAVASNLPIVTCPGELMFGRQSYGILKMLRVEETIAYNEQEYIDISVKLGLDHEFRNKIKEKMKLNQDRVFNDVECVKSLEEFYQKVVEEKLTNQILEENQTISLIKERSFVTQQLLNLTCQNNQNYDDYINPDLLENLPCDASLILEIGCGNNDLGELYKLINPHCQYIRIKINENFGNIVSKELDQVIIGNIEKLDFNILDINEKTIDCIIYRDILENIVNPHQILKEHQKWLKDDGQIIALSHNIQPWTTIIDSLKRKSQDHDYLDQTNLRFLTLSYIQDLFNQADLKIFDIKYQILNQSSVEIFRNVKYLLNKFNINTDIFQYIIRSQKSINRIEKILIQTKETPSICRLVRVREPDHFSATIPGVKVIHNQQYVDYDIGKNYKNKVFIWQRLFLDYQMNLEEIWNMQKYLIKEGYLVVAELDDSLTAWSENIKHLYLKFLNTCHCLQTSTQPLADSMKEFCTNIVIFPNQLAFLPPLKINDNSEEITIFFGAQNRKLSWSKIMPSLNKLIKQYGKFLKFKVVHDQEFFEALETDKKEFQSWCHYSRYLEILKYCDIALLPLENNLFDSMKSDLKFIECAGYGVVALASPTVYADSIIEGKTGLIYHSIEEFELKLNELIINHNQRKQTAINAYNWVKENRLLSQHYHQRVEWYLKMCQKLPMLNQELFNRVPELFI